MCICLSEEPLECNVIEAFFSLEVLIKIMDSTNDFFLFYLLEVLFLGTGNSLWSFVLKALI